MSAEIVRVGKFAIVGIANTALDFSLLFVFVYFAHIDNLIANVMSTGIAMSISFWMNRKWTFGSDGDSRRQIMLFILVTLFGLWVLQTFVIWLIMIPAIRLFTEPVALFGAKLMATLVSLSWNYIMYARVVFTGSESDKS